MHVCTTRVRYAETDQGGVAYHANYLNWFEVGRTDMLRTLGHPYARIERDLDILLTVTEAHLSYRSPALYDELLRIETRIMEMRKVRFRVATRILRAEDEGLLCDGSVWLASVTRDGRPIPLPESLAGVLSAELQSEEGKTGTQAVVTG